MEHAHLEIASGILNIVLATVDLVGVAHDTTVWFSMSAATVMVWAFSRLALRVAVATLAQPNVHYNVYFTQAPKLLATIVHKTTSSQ